MPELTPAEARVLLDSARPPRLLDCREEEEYRRCKIAGAENLPLTRWMAEFAPRLPNLAEPILVYCHHGMRSGRAVQFLLEQGYSNVMNLSGGIDRWSREIDPSVPRY